MGSCVIEGHNIYLKLMYRQDAILTYCILYFIRTRCCLNFFHQYFSRIDMQRFLNRVSFIKKNNVIFNNVLLGMATSFYIWYFSFSCFLYRLFYQRHIYSLVRNFLCKYNIIDLVENVSIYYFVIGYCCYCWWNISYYCLSQVERYGPYTSVIWP